MQAGIDRRVCSRQQSRIDFHLAILLLEVLRLFLLISNDFRFMRLISKKCAIIPLILWIQKIFFFSD
jgi:hypothetical protein